MTKTKRGIPDAVKREEGRRLKAIWERKSAADGVKQDSFCASIGLNQGMLQQMFKGQTAIPLDTLLNLSISLNFNPEEVRPGIAETYKKMTLALAGRDSKMALKVLQEMSDSGRAEAEALLGAVETSLLPISP